MEEMIQISKQEYARLCRIEEVAVAAVNCQMWSDDYEKFYNLMIDLNRAVYNNEEK